MDTKAESIFKKIVEKFNSSEAEGLNVVYLFQVKNADEITEKYFIQVQNEACNLHVNNSDLEPNVTLSASEENWKAIISGETNAHMAFMMGKLSIDGDFPMALKLTKIFGLA